MNDVNRIMVESEDFELYLRVKQGLNQSTITGYLSKLNVLQRWLKENNQTLEKQAIEKFLSAHAENPGYINLFIYFLRQLENYLKDRGSPLDLTTGFKTRKVERPFIKILSVDEVKKLIDTPILYYKQDPRLLESDDMYRTLTKFIYLTCCRISEAVELKVGNVDLGGGWVVFTNTKGKKFRKVPIQEPLITELALYIKGKTSEEYLFINRMGKPVDNTSFQYNLKRRGFEAGITTRLYPHILRHSGASHLVMAGVPIELVSQILGHAELNTTMENYIHLKDEQLQNAMFQMPYYREKTSPKVIIGHILEVLKQFKLQDDNRFSFRLEEGSQSLNLTLFVK